MSTEAKKMWVVTCLVDRAPVAVFNSKQAACDYLGIGSEFDNHEDYTVDPAPMNPPGKAEDAYDDDA